MCHAIVEMKYRTDTANKEPMLLPAADETDLLDIVIRAKSNEEVIRIRVYRIDASFIRVEKWETAE